MKSPLRKFQGFVQSKSEPKEKKDSRRQHPPAMLDELDQASQDRIFLYFKHVQPIDGGIDANVSESMEKCLETCLMNDAGEEIKKACHKHESGED